MSDVATPGQINLVVRDLARSIAFYRHLGSDVGAPTGLHVSIAFGNGFTIDLDQHEFAQQWNIGTPAVIGGSAVLCLNVAERGDIDATVERMWAAGHRVRQVPYDPFWGSRFAIVGDPDGYQIGLMTSSAAEHRYWPPRDAPTASHLIIATSVLRSSTFQSSKYQPKGSRVHDRVPVRARRGRRHDRCGWRPDR